jgi:hypothetical protein
MTFGAAQMSSDSFLNQLRDTPPIASMTTRRKHSAVTHR